MSDAQKLKLDVPKSKEELIRQYAQSLHFPPYWRSNWDSFEECLATILEGNEQAVEVSHIGWAESDFDRLQPYRSVLSNLAEGFENLRIADFGVVAGGKCL